MNTNGFRNAAQHARNVVLAAAAIGALLAPSPAPAKGAQKAGAPIVLGTPKSFAAAVAAIEKATGAKDADLELRGKPLLADEGRSFRIEGHVATRLIEGSHAPFLKAGLYLFRHERNFGMGGGLDIVGLIKTTDRDALIRRVGTSDPAKKATTDQIIAFLGALEKDAPFALEEIGEDFVAGHFTAVPKDPIGIARRCAEFAPELIKGSGRAIDYLAEEIKANRTLYLIW
jgi:hypothetical protein